MSLEKEPEETEVETEEGEEEVSEEEAGREGWVISNITSLTNTPRASGRPKKVGI